MPARLAGRRPLPRTTASSINRSSVPATRPYRRPAISRSIRPILPPSSSRSSPRPWRSRPLPEETTEDQKPGEPCCPSRPTTRRPWRPRRDWTASRRRLPGSGPSRPSTATRSWPSWAAAAWASSTAPEQIRLNRPCVLKMILAGAHADAEAAARFLAEAEAVARLQHPNIVQIYHIGEADGLPFFELEFVAGGSLDRRLDGHALAAAAGGRADRGGGARRRRGAPPGHRPPRPQAGQHPAGGRRHAQDHRLRPGQVAGPRTAA